MWHEGKWPGALRSFSGRLRLHCHFIQKLEDEPRIEFENMHPAYDGLRESDFNEAYYAAWQAGKTGYPMVDACMRMLTATGWLNFRMRAMLMSFASYHLWLHWRKPALHLARLFTGYERASITARLKCNRVPQASTAFVDPDGTFIREWVPELAGMQQEFIHTPWKAPSQMNDYPIPVVDEKTARKATAEKLYRLRKNTAHKEIARKIFNKHGSRKSGLRGTGGRKKSKNNTQGELPL